MTHVIAAMAGYAIGMFTFRAMKRIEKYLCN